MSLTYDGRIAGGAYRAAANFLCGWLPHSKVFLLRFVHLSEAVMCPACLHGLDRWPSLSGRCWAMPCRAVDGFRKPSPIELCGLYRPGPSTGCPGFGGRLMHHHLAGLANSLFFFLSGCVWCVRLVSGQDRPSNPCRFVGHGDSGDSGRFTFKQ